MKELQPQQLIERFLVPPGKRISLPTDYDPADSAPYSSKKGTSTVLRRDLERLAAFQGRLFAQKTYAVLVILQGMDAAGKDSVVKHVMSGINPQGCQVWSFKEPSGEDLEHDYLWRVERAVPPRGMIGIFNRSYYEEVLVVRVHPQLLARQRLPQALMNKNIWRRRFDEINAFEQYLTANGIVILKFFLNISKDEQKQRFLERIERPEKNWKFSLSDVHERAHWDAYMR
ncbi:MAG: polyphosphate kinase 2 family protein, partial [Chloroflexi bacterium]|nr:polyphosphate kinase 2 family protein [Chloroflexota bacterium]